MSKPVVAITQSPWSQLPGGRLLLRQALHKLRTVVGSLLVGTIWDSLPTLGAAHIRQFWKSSAATAGVTVVGADAPAVDAEGASSALTTRAAAAAF